MLKGLAIGAIAVVALAGGGIWFASSKGSTATDAVIKTTERGGNDAEVLAAMQRNPQPLSADDVIKLKKAGVSDKVIIEMLDKSGSKIAETVAR